MHVQAYACTCLYMYMYELQHACKYMLVHAWCNMYELDNTSICLYMHGAICMNLTIFHHACTSIYLYIHAYSQQSLCLEYTL